MNNMDAINICFLLTDSEHHQPIGSSHSAQYCSWRQTQEERCIDRLVTTAITTTATARATRVQGTPTSGALVHLTGTKEPAEEQEQVGGSPEVQSVPLTAGTGVRVAPALEEVMVGIGGTDTITLDMEFHQGLVGKKVEREVVGHMGTGGAKVGAQGGTIEAGIVEVPLEVGVRVLMEERLVVGIRAVALTNMILAVKEVGTIVEALEVEVGITEDLLQAGIIEAVHLEVGTTGVVLLEVGITAEVLLEEPGTIEEEEVLLEVGIIEEVLLEVGIIEEVLLVAGIIAEVLLEGLGIIEEVKGVGTIAVRLEVVGITAEDLVAGTTEEVLVALGEVVVVAAVVDGMKEVLEGEDGKTEVLEEEGGKKGDLEEEDGLPVEVEEVIDGKNEDQVGVLEAAEEEEEEEGGMDQIGDGTAAVVGVVAREAGVTTKDMRLVGNMVVAAEVEAVVEVATGVAVVEVEETGDEILHRRVEEAGGTAATGVAQSVKALACRSEFTLGRGFDPAWADYLFGFFPRFSPTLMPGILLHVADQDMSITRNITTTEVTVEAAAAEAADPATITVTGTLHPMEDLLGVEVEVQMDLQATEDPHRICHIFMTGMGQVPQVRVTMVEEAVLPTAGYRQLLVDLRGKDVLEGRGDRWENNIKMDLREMGYDRRGGFSGEAHEAALHLFTKRNFTYLQTPFSRWTEGDERDVLLAGKPPAWLSRLRYLPVGLKLGSGAGSIPAWADCLDDNNALSESAMRISYKICHEIAKELKTFNEGEFTKRCLIILADELCPQQVGELEAIRLSRKTVVRRLQYASLVDILLPILWFFGIYPSLLWMNIRSLYRRPPGTTGSLNLPPWNVAKRRWMTSATITRGGPTRGKEFRLGPTGGSWGKFSKQECKATSVSQSVKALAAGLKLLVRSPRGLITWLFFLRFSPMVK
ncbi:hypothetical protein ANN_03380 [Periplaneta americana]|uniref:Uncharacterized protein n=1 Tax=Periplaneta americana TaxID=6978 RepID=A0ABQ8TYW2_PERAM|nr:hypothetical protein ANN_03380 [Periplaneta americana]